MAPGRHIEDDFVLTIDSGDEQPVGLEDEDSESDAEPSKSSSSKKRRRPEETVAADAAKAAKKRKHSKKGKKHAEEVEEESDDEEVDGPQGWADGAGEKDGALNPDFEFQLEQDAGVFEDFDAWEREEEKEKDPRKKGVDMDALIERKRALKDIKVNGTTKAQQSESEAEDEENATEAVGEELSDDESDDGSGFGMGVPLGEDDEAEESQEAFEDGDMTDESDVADDMDAEHGDVGSDDDSSVGDPEEDARQKAFFATDEGPKGGTSSNFQSMKLSRPILRGLTSIGFSSPTPIQAKTIPMALLGKDVVGGAVTGSGKTGAFMIPILERLLYRNQKVPTSRVAVLMPTRELAVQCFNVATKLASYTDITFCQLVGGFSLREQENILKKRPDVIIATPGRFIDHMRNSASFTVDTLEILVLDEADRMLEQGFADELNEILATIPRSRQTMLFSATMTSSVDELIRVGLNKPVRLMVDSKRQTVGTLTQEFVRLRQGREDKRLAYLLYLCSNVFEDRCIIFFRQKKEAHRVRIILGLFGMKVAELHGSLSQEQRIQSVESFRAGKVTHLLATDVASRGLDIKGVEAVINYEAPQSHEIYLHRVGRTARAGRSGRACTIAGEPDRKVVRAAVKVGKSQGAKIVSRVVEPEVADEWAAKIDALEKDVEDLLKEEKDERQLQSFEMQLRKGENLIAHESEIMSRPRRDWFQSEREKLAAKKAGIEQLNGTHGSSKKKKLKLSNKDKKKLDTTRERKEGREWKKGKAERGLSGKPSVKGKKQTKGKKR